jgi:hypothetical protein
VECGTLMVWCFEEGDGLVNGDVLEKLTSLSSEASSLAQRMVSPKRAATMIDPGGCGGRGGGVEVSLRPNHLNPLLLHLPPAPGFHFTLVFNV